MRSVLILGASGLVGGRLIEHLLSLGSVRIRAASRVERTWPPAVEGSVVDFGRPSTLFDACSGMEAAINLASMDERACARDPLTALHANAGGALVLASAAAKAGVARLVHLSTYKVYGDTPGGPVTEETLCHPQSHYAITHHAAEHYVRSQHPSGVVLRLANGFGAPVSAVTGAWDIIVNEICRQVVVDRRIAIRSSGKGWRNFVPIADVVRALELATNVIPAGTYNLGSPQSMTLRDLARRVATVSQATLGFCPDVSVGASDPSDSPVALDYRIDKLAAAGHAATASFDEEVRRTLLAARLLCGANA